EAVTVHDVKAVEYTVKEALVEIGADDLSELVHFCCTSEDINNLSWALGIKGATEQVWLPRAKALIDTLAESASALAEVPMLAHTYVYDRLGLTFTSLTTQIESHDWDAELFADIARFNRIAHNLATDMWTYISMNYFKQIPVAGATGSSTMPHKVNPIRFENAE